MANAPTAKTFGVAIDQPYLDAQLKEIAKGYEKIFPDLAKRQIKASIQKFAGNKGSKLAKQFRAGVPKGQAGNSFNKDYTPGMMRKSVGTKTFYSRGPGSGVSHTGWVLKVGLMRSKTKRGFYGIMNEYGTKQRTQGVGSNKSVLGSAAIKLGAGRNVGRIEPRPFLNKCVRSLKTASLETFTKFMKEGLDNAVKQSLSDYWRNRAKRAGWG